MNEIYNQYSFFTIILITEFAIVSLFAFVIIILHTVYEEKRKRTRQIRENLKEILYQIITDSTKKVSLSFPKAYAEPVYLVPVIESIDERIFTTRWKQLKNMIFEDILFPHAIKNLKSLFWIKRNWSARIFAIENDEEHEKVILDLVKDKHPLIRLQAIKPAIDLQTKHAIYTLISIMSKENKIASYLYRDALLKSSSNTFRIIKDILKEERDQEKRISCLEVFTHRTDVAILNMIHNDIHSDNLKLRLITLQILANYPNEFAIKELIEALDDENWEVRSTSAISLGKLGVKKVIPKLMEMLSDRTWRVRYNSALALRSMGDEGLKTLKNIDQDVDPYAYDVAQFVYSIGY